MPCNQKIDGGMEMEKRLFTSESVTEGHPDKIADQISDAVLDEILTQDPKARVACEVAVNTGLVLVFGEISTTAYVDIQQIVRQTLTDIGYTKREYGFMADEVAVLVSIDEQSPDIAQGVDESIESRQQDHTPSLGAGDQGIMFGYASDQTQEWMPMPIALSHRLAKRLAQVRKEDILSYLGPDGKTQVTVEYDENNQPCRVDTIVISSQHTEDVTLDQLEKDIKYYVIDEVIPKEWLDEGTHVYINPTGKFVIGGPKGDSGLTGRKIIVDTYGGYARHGGGAFSGKDATKVDRSASYMARYIAKNIVAAGIAKECEIQLSYAIGKAEPTSIMIETFGTSDVSQEKLVKVVRELFDLTPSGIIKTLQLDRPIFKQTAAYGHFGRDDIQVPWEQLDQVDALKDKLLS